MIPHIDEQLARWEAWLRSGKTRLGYPAQSAFVAAMAAAGDQQTPLPDEEALHLCAAVRALDPVLRITVETCYRTLRGRPVKEIARALGCSRQTVHDRISRAHVHILGSLLDLAAGIPVPPYPDTPDTPPNRRTACPNDNRLPHDNCA